MKYIRTKDGIYKSKRNPIEKDCLVIGEKENGELGLIVKDIIAKTDTIKEVCDELVVIGIPNRTIIIREIDYKQQGLTLKQYVSLLFAQYEHIIIYGAIWTDKGLIYVAKLNSKGEFKLL